MCEIKVKKRITAAVLPVVLTVCVLMMLMVMLVISVMDMNVILLGQIACHQKEKNNIESAFRLYCNYPQIIEQTQDSISILLFDDKADSRITVNRKLWGLYEVISVAMPDRRQHTTKIIGIRQPQENGYTMWYKDNKGTITLSGNSNLKGRLLLPQNGVVYGHGGANMFTGELIQRHNIGISNSDMMMPNPESKSEIMKLLSLAIDNNGYSMLTKDIVNDFYGCEPNIVYHSSKELKDVRIGGNVILVGDKLEIDSTCILSNVLISARQVTIGNGFKGSLQIFATDTVIVQNQANLSYPSGIYSQTYIDINDRAEINGYVIVENSESENLTLRQSPLSKVKGFVYALGPSQIQGVVKGMVVVDNARYYSQEGFYSDFFHDFTLLQNSAVALPHWSLDRKNRRKEICRVR